jgi:hypothetical protein
MKIRLIAAREAEGCMRLCHATILASTGFSAVPV